MPLSQRPKQPTKTRVVSSGHSSESKLFIENILKNTVLYTDSSYTLGPPCDIWLDYKFRMGIPQGTPEKMAGLFWKRLEEQYSLETVKHVKTLLAFRDGDFLTRHPAGVNCESLRWTPALQEIYAPWIALLYWNATRDMDELSVLTGLASVLQPTCGVFEYLPDVCRTLHIYLHAV